MLEQNLDFYFWMVLFVIITSLLVGTYYFIDYLRRKKRNDLHLLRYPVAVYALALISLPFLSPYQYRTVLEPEYIVAKERMGTPEYHVIAEEKDYVVWNKQKNDMEKYQLEITRPVNLFGYEFPEYYTLLIPDSDGIVLWDSLCGD